MTEPTIGKPADKGRGKAFFDQADQVAATGNWDYAIEMYLQGLVREPDNMERGYKPVWETALKRKAEGGKGPGMMEQLKHRPGKDPIENLRNALFLWSREPGSVAYMESALLAAGKLELKEVCAWVACIILDAQRQAKRKDLGVLKRLAATMEAMQGYRLALEAVKMAIQQAPKDGELGEAVRGLEARLTIQQGKYGEEGSFTKGVKDIKKQIDLSQEDRAAGGQSRNYLDEQVTKARQEYEASPMVIGKINALVEALVRVGEEGCDHEAIDVLTKAHKDTNAYQFRMRIGDIKIGQAKRRYQALIQAGDKPAALEQARALLELELAEYADRAANYPTDLEIKYELGRRLLVAGKLDDAIAALQQAQRSPRRHVSSMIMLGKAFTRKEWYREASDTYERVKESEMREDLRKEVLYDLGDVYEKMGRKAESPKEAMAKAMDCFSQLAQMDFGYKDVRDRLEKLRKELA